MALKHDDVLNIAIISVALYALIILVIITCCCLRLREKQEAQLREAIRLEEKEKRKANVVLQQQNNVQSVKSLHYSGRAKKPKQVACSNSYENHAYEEVQMNNIDNTKDCSELIENNAIIQTEENKEITQNNNDNNNNEETFSCEFNSPQESSSITPDVHSKKNTYHSDTSRSGSSNSTFINVTDDKQYEGIHSEGLALDDGSDRYIRNNRLPPLNLPVVETP